MDLRSLINKLDTIEQRTLLQESEQLVDEAARLRYKDVEAVAKQHPTDEVARGKALADLAKANGLPGLFDPVSRELVKLDGTLSNFLGADEATVNQLQQWGLLPLGAKTSSWLGIRGRDEKTAMGANQSAQARDDQTDKAMALMDKAVQAAAAPAANEGALSTSGIASALIEEFGFNGIELLETITPAEHTELKKLVQDLYKAAPADPDVVQVTTTYNGYLKQRNQIIQRINELIKIIKAKPTKESLETSERRMIAEGRIQVLEDGKRYLRDGLVWTYDPKTELYSHLNEDGTLTEYDKKQFYSDAGDFGRGVADGVTLGYADNISAGVQSLFTNKTYKDALRAEIAKSKEADERSPWLYGGGQVAGFIANPLSKIGLGLPGMLGKMGIPLAAAKIASDKFVREPWNASVVNAPDKKNTKQSGMDKNAVIAMQKEFKALKVDLGTSGPNKDGVDGDIGKKTRDAMAKYPEIAKKYSAGTVKKVDAAAAPAAAEPVATAPAAAEPAVAAAPTPAAVVAAAPEKKSAIDALTPTATAAAAPAAPAAAEKVATAPAAEVDQVPASANASSSMTGTNNAKLSIDGSGSGMQAAPAVADAPIQVDRAKIKSMIADIRKLAKDNGLDFYTAMDQYANTADLAEGIQLTVEQQQYLTEINSIRRLSGLPLLEYGQLLPILSKFTKPAADAIKAGWTKLSPKLRGNGAGRAEKEAAEAAEAAAKAARQQADDALAAAQQAANKVRQIPPALRTATDKLAIQAEKQAADKVAALARGEATAATRVAAPAVRTAAAGADDAATAAARTAAATTERTLLSRFGAGGMAALSKLKSLGGSALKFMGNNKFLTLAAMIGAAGYIFGTTGVEEEDLVVVPPATVTGLDVTVVVPDKDGKCPPGMKLSVDGKSCEPVGQSPMPVTPEKPPVTTPVPPAPAPAPAPATPDVSELQKLVDQLYGGWPTDPETAAALAAAKAAGAKVPEGSGTDGQAGMSTNVSGRSKALSDFDKPKDFAAGQAAERKPREAGTQ